MFASLEYHSNIEIRIYDGSGGSVMIAKANDLCKARQIVDLMNECCQFTPGLQISKKK